MISLIVLAASHREAQLKQFIECLEEEEVFNSCQKILVFDGKLKSIEDHQLNVLDWEVAVPKRIDGLYCWSNAINEGIKRSNFDKILYLDGDRIVSSSFFSEIKNIKDNEFLFPKNLYGFKNDMPLEKIKEYKKNQTFCKKLMLKDYREFKNPDNSFGRKNPMSGCVAFTKKTYIRTGGFDQMYTGYGYADIDYFRKTYNLGCEFIPFDCVEYHLYHTYFPQSRELIILNCFWNAVKYCKKWGLNPPSSVMNAAKPVELTLDDIKKNEYLEDFEKYFELREQFKNKKIF